MKIGWYSCIFLLVTCWFTQYACSNKKQSIVAASAMNEAVKKELQLMIASIKGNKIDDSTFIYSTQLLPHFYKETTYQPLWSNARDWNAITDSFLQMMEQGVYFGLIKEDYQYDSITKIKKLLDEDSLKISAPDKWARVELLLTDAFFHMLQDVKQGRLQHDSLDWVRSPEKWKSFFLPQFQRFTAGAKLHALLQDLEPSQKEYKALKKALANYVGTMDNKRYTYVHYPYKDSLLFIKKFKERMQEAGLLNNANIDLDAPALADLITRYQQSKDMKVSGKISVGFINSLNNNDQEKFYRAAITLDKFKSMKDTFPERYIIVNLPAYQLKVWDHDTIALESKVIIGKSTTPTPHIISAISNLVIYPTWTVPKSIIASELLPGLKRNPGYLAKKGLGLYTYKGDPVNAFDIDWSKYTKSIPYLVRQSSGDNNALGIIKFNFINPYDVYLHDTNQRYLFKNKNRSLSHGCVRVEEWKKLAFYIARNDSIQNNTATQIGYNTDSLSQWLGQKTYRTVYVKKRLPLYILYLSVEAQKGQLIFFDDVYGEDKAFREKYFAQK